MDICILRVGTPEVRWNEFELDGKVTTRVQSEIDFAVVAPPAYFSDGMFWLRYHLNSLMRPFDGGWVSLELVRAEGDTRPRCLRCGLLTDHKNTHCATCGAPL